MKNENIIALIYLKVNIENNGEKSRTLFEVTHIKKTAVSHWNIDNYYVGTT